MEYAKFNNGTTVPMLGFGVWRVEDGPTCVAAVRNALDVGYRHIDTAAIYGNEKGVGQAIRESGIPREDIFLTTKVWNEVQRSGVVADAFEESLEKLGTDYVDLYLVHWPVPGKYVDTYLELEKIYKSGRAKSIGVCNFHEHHLEDIKKVWSVVPALNQVELHPRLTQKPLIKFCQDLGIVPQSWSPLGGGKSPILEEPALIEVSKKYGKSPAQVVLRWNIDNGIIVIPKSVTPSRIKENFNIFDFKLDEDDIAKIDALHTGERTGSSPDSFTF